MIKKAHIRGLEMSSASRQKTPCNDARGLYPMCERTAVVNAAHPLSLSCLGSLDQPGHGFLDLLVRQPLEGLLLFEAKV